MKNEKLEIKNDIAARSIQYALQVIRLYRDLQQDEVGRAIGKQFLRSGTSIGANVQEAQGAQSKADFIAKMSIAHKEALESAYWLRLFEKAEIIPEVQLVGLVDETDQLIKILSAILITAKRGKKTI
ncbi:MAG: four helix bundle protein [Desulfobulbaceae bacterium]|nr:four helix bundle protein [Desulfobulbaceae bacterium]